MGSSARRIAVLVVLLIALTGPLWANPYFTRRLSPAGATPPRDAVATACALGKELLRPIRRGHDPRRSEDVTMVPAEPNYSGSFDVTSHSGPWAYLQTIPLVFYGPGRIRASGAPLDAPASIVDIYLTVGELVGVRLPRRDGSVLNEALSGPRSGPPKLVVVVVWDGVGRNVLEEWPDAWPTLSRLEREGTSFVRATIGSSPSVTPTTHASLGTGFFPRRHRVTAIELRTETGKVRTAFAHQNPSDLAKSTFADAIDRRLRNEPKVGLVGWRAWHQGMLGHGRALEGGDRDLLALIDDKGVITGRKDLYGRPPYLDNLDPSPYLARLDRKDGVADGLWLDHDVEQQDNPAWVRFQSEVIKSVVRREGYGADRVPDLLFVNFKMTDILAHQYGIDGEEMHQVLAAQDEALGRLLELLDKRAGDYVAIVTADHGHTPPAARTGAWPISQGEFQRDLDERFGIPKGSSLIEKPSAAGPFLDRNVMKEARVTPEEVAAFATDYKLGDNWPGRAIPPGFEGSVDESVFAAAFSKRQFSEVMRCAFPSVKRDEAEQGID